ncbi:MAG TPA: ACP S-malonyltransferase [Candidatus Acidoferrales bacterium]|nr:ACP S-malonyltransferase [Candidatus Acidoferrales bacterium]
MATAAFIFPGQGSQASGMGSDVAAHFPESRKCFELASKVLGYDLLERVRTASEEELKETRLSQPAIFTANVAIYRAVATLGLQPVATAGHSFGEYCSLEIAAAMDFSEAVRVVNERGLAMGEASDRAPGAMAAIIGMEEQAVDGVCRQAREQTGARVDIGNLNTLTQIVISGDVAGVEAACEIAKEVGAKRVRMLNVSGAWHSSLMEPAMPRFAHAVEQAHVRMPAFTVMSNVFARPYRSVEEIKEALIASLCSRVRWHEAAVALLALRPDVVIECGASEVLAPMVKRLPDLGATRVMHVADVAGLESARSALGSSAA